MEFNSNFGNNGKKFNKHSMQCMPRHYGTTTQTHFPVNPPINNFVFREHGENIIGNKMTANPMMNGFNNVFGSNPIISEKTFKSYDTPAPSRISVSTENPLSQPCISVLQVSVDNPTYKEPMMTSFNAFTNIVNGLFNNVLAAFPVTVARPSDSTTQTMLNAEEVNNWKDTRDQASWEQYKSDMIIPETVNNLKEQMVMADKKQTSLLDECQQPGHSINTQINSESAKSSWLLDSQGVTGKDKSSLESPAAVCVPLCSQQASSDKSVINLVPDCSTAVETSQKSSVSPSLSSVCAPDQGNQELTQKPVLKIVIDHSTQVGTSKCEEKSQCNLPCFTTVQDIVEPSVDEVDFSPNCDIRSSDMFATMNQRRWQPSQEVETLKFTDTKPKSSCQGVSTKVEEIETILKPTKSRFLQAVRQRAAESKEKIAEEKADSVSKCEDKLARLKEILSTSKLQRSTSISCDSDCKSVSSSTPCVSDVVPPAFQYIKSDDVSKPSLCGKGTSPMVTPPDNTNINIEDCIENKERSESAPENHVQELEILFNHLSLDDNVKVSSSSDVKPSTSVDKLSIENQDLNTSNDESNVSINKFNVQDDVIQITTMISTIEITNIPITDIVNNIVKEDISTDIIKSEDEVLKSTVSGEIVSKEPLPEETKPVKVTISNCEDKMAKLKALLAKKKQNSKINVEERQPDKIEVLPNVSLKAELPVVSTVESVVCTKPEDLPCPIEENKNHLMTTELKPPKKNKRTKLQKNHRLSSAKYNESYAYSEDVSDNMREGTSHDRLSPSKHNDKVCSKKHKNEHCSSKHRHKDRLSYKKDIRDDLVSDLDYDNLPVYFTPDTLELHKPARSKKAKRQKKPGKKYLNSQELVKRETIPKGAKNFSERIGKCVSFLSKLPAQLSPGSTFICRGRQPKIEAKPRLSSTESEDCFGFDEVKGRFKKQASECESDDSFVIVFSDSNKDKEDDAEKGKEIIKPKECEILRRVCPPRVRMTSECESEDSFVVCFEKDGSDSADDVYGNDDVYSDSDSNSSEDDDEDQSSNDDESTTESSGYGEESDNVKLNEVSTADCVDNVDCEVFDENGDKILRSCIKRKADRCSPKPSSRQLQTKKVNILLYNTLFTSLMPNPCSI